MKVLVLQKSDVLDAQRETIESTLSGIEGIEIGIASSAEDVVAHDAATVLITPSLPFLPEALQRLPNIDWIHFLSAGVDPIWQMDVAWEKYRITKSSGVHASTISEYVIGAVLYALKGFGQFTRQQRQGEWKRFWLDECRGKTLGIIGIGTIGRHLASLGSTLGMRVIGTVGTPRPIDYVDTVYGSENLPTVLAESDFVVLLVPLTDQTRGMIGPTQFEMMKQDSWLINVARGGVVQEAALAEALKSEAIGGAVLDVFKEEPLPATSPLWEMENVLITPHVAGTTQHYMKRALEVFRDNYQSYVSTGELTTPVSVEKGY